MTEPIVAVLLSTLSLLRLRLEAGVEDGGDTVAETTIPAPDALCGPTGHDLPLPARRPRITRQEAPTS
ncbi:MAG: hypothetical protein ACREOC_01430 [Gemmatimonadales bacterium]